MGYDTDRDPGGFDLQQWYRNMFGTFDQTGHEWSDDTDLSIRMIKASATLDDMVEFLDDRNIDPNEFDRSDVQDLDVSEQHVLRAFAAMGDSLQRLADLGDDDEDNPFKVSDGDDPIY